VDTLRGMRGEGGLNRQMRRRKAWQGDGKKNGGVGR